MPKPDLREATSAYEPLLPIEKKLIGWSLGTGLALLVRSSCHQSFRSARLKSPDFPPSYLRHEERRLRGASKTYADERLESYALFEIREPSGRAPRATLLSRGFR